MERDKPYKAINVKETSWHFDLSDIKNDKTQYLDKTPHLKSNPNSPFEPKEISARSTHIQPKKVSLDFDEIMNTTKSEAVRNKYRESLEVRRLSTLQKAPNRTYNASPQNTNENSIRTTSNKRDFWDDTNPVYSSFVANNNTFSNEEFVPAEEMAGRLEEDEKLQEMEHAAIPRKNINCEDTLNWENNLSRQPEMSFGQYCMNQIMQTNIRDIYGSTSPPKLNNERIPLIPISENENSLTNSDFYDSRNLEKIIKNNPSRPELLIKKKFKEVSKDISNILNNDKTNKPYSIISTNNIKDHNLDTVPEHDDDDENMDDLQRYGNELQIRGLKRKQSLVNSNETPKSALEKCLRSKSPSRSKELEIAAERLKPKMVNDENVFKIPPKPNDSSTLKSCLKSTSSILTDISDAQKSSEYLSAMNSLSLNSPSGKLSLPNYPLQRPERSPTSSMRSNNSQWSPEQKLRRSASQLSNDSEFSDDFLPIKINNIDNRKISFPSLKINKTATKSISIQNSSNKKLPLRLKIIGAGFSVTPQEEFRMVPMEARTFDIKFTPSIVGPARGCLVFEHITNKQCSKSIPLYGYGGHSSISIENIQRGPFGPGFITMGNIKDLKSMIVQPIKLINKGTLPSFVTIAFERTKLSDFVLSNSISLEPTQLKIDPGMSAEVKIRFKATKSEIRKIISFNKDVTTIGEICVMSGDEPTRLRILKNKHFVEQKLLDFLPKSLPNDIETQAKLAKFNEELSREKLTFIMKEIKTQEIALTINRDLEDSVFLSAEMSLADDTHMSFETFIDNTVHIPNVMDTICSMPDNFDDSIECLESKNFRIVPAELHFIRSIDNCETSKFIKLESLSDELLYLEVVPSNSSILTAIRPIGKLNPGEFCEIKVSATQKAFKNSNFLQTSVVLIINNSRFEIPVKISDSKND